MAHRIIKMPLVKKESTGAVFDAAEAKENNTIGKRLAEAQKAMGLTNHDVCDRLRKYNINVLPGAISKWEVGTTTPNCYQLMALCSVLNIDDVLDYLVGVPSLNEEGRRKLSEYKADLLATGLYAPPSGFETEIIYVQKPVSNLAVSAGVGNFLDEDSFEMMNFPANSVPAGADFAVRIAGDSMEPVYSNGQYVWVKKCTEVPCNQVGIFVYDGEGYIKMYTERTQDEPEAFTDSEGVLRKQPILISYNAKYSPIHIAANADFHVIGRVL